MSHDLSTITQGTLKTSRAWAQAFRDYAAIAGNMGNVDLIISGEKNIMRFPKMWEAFLKSQPARVLLENPPVPDTPWYDDTPVPLAVVPSQQIIDIPHVDVTPIIPSQPIAVETTPIAPPMNQHGSKNALIELIAQGLQEIAYKPEQALSAEYVESIAESTATRVVSQVIEQLENEGKLGKKTDVLRIQINDKPIKEISGRLPKFFPELLKLAQCNVPAFLVGPAGCGKTTAAEKLAEVLDVPFTRVSLSAGVDEGILQGWLLPVGDSGKFSYVPAPMVTAYETGGVVLLDEIDSADANMLIILSAVLDRSAWHIPLRYEAPALVKHPRVYFMAAANTFGHGASMQFVGSNQLDERTLSRLRQGQIHCDYDNDLEAEEFDAGIVEYGHLLRARCRAVPQFKRDISTRDIAQNHDKVSTCDEYGRPLYTTEQAWYHHFADWKTDELSKVHVVRDLDMQTAVLE